MRLYRQRFVEFFPVQFRQSPVVVVIRETNEFEDADCFGKITAKLFFPERIIQILMGHTLAFIAFLWV